MFTSKKKISKKEKTTNGERRIEKFKTGIVTLIIEGIEINYETTLQSFLKNIKETALPKTEKMKAIAIFCIMREYNPLKTHTVNQPALLNDTIAWLNMTKATIDDDSLKRKIEKETIRKCESEIAALFLYVWRKEIEPTDIFLDLCIFFLPFEVIDNSAQFFNREMTAVTNKIQEMDIETASTSGSAPAHSYPDLQEEKRSVILYKIENLISLMIAEILLEIKQKGFSSKKFKSFAEEDWQMQLMLRSEANTISRAEELLHSMKKLQEILIYFPTSIKCMVPLKLFLDFFFVSNYFLSQNDILWCELKERANIG